MEILLALKTEDDKITSRDVAQEGQEGGKIIPSLGPSKVTRL